MLGGACGGGGGSASTGEGVETGSSEASGGTAAGTGGDSGAPTSSTGPVGTSGETGEPTSGPGTSSQGESTGPVGSCDELADCDGCAACSVGSSCAAAVSACTQDPQCQPYQQCVGACAEGDKACLDACEDMYPGGYETAWAQYDCAVCEACPTACAANQPYCQAGGGGPHNECASNADCVELYDSLPFCVERRCIECLTTDNCFFDGSLCVDGFCT